MITWYLIIGCLLIYLFIKDEPEKSAKSASAVQIEATKKNIAICNH
jgi:hypothetical protein